MGKKKKNIVIDDDEYLPAPELSEYLPKPILDEYSLGDESYKDPLVKEDKGTLAGGKKKGKKKNLKGAQGREEEDDAGLKKKGVTRAAENQSELRTPTPICCILGPGDAGKTKLLDRIRGTIVHKGEAEGITKQIGSTYFPAEDISKWMKELNHEAKLKFPGLLVIDTPGHESFRNLRIRAELCGIAILVVDITCGLELQTIESLDLLKMRDKEFIVALSKVDQLKGWISYPNVSIQKAIDKQTSKVRKQFKLRHDEIVADFKRQGLRTEVCYKIKDKEDHIHQIVPTSAICGEGITDLLLVLVRKLQKRKMEKLTFTNEVKCTVLEVMHIEGHEPIIDVVLVDGVLRERDQIVVCGKKGPIVTTIDAFLTPLPKQELSIKGTYLHKEIKAVQGIKISAKNIEHAIAGTGLYVVGSDDDRKRIIELAEEGMSSFIIDKSAVGVCVLASTLGTLEALVELLKSSAMNIPVHFVKIGAVNEKDVKKAGLMKKKEYATILALDVEVKPEVQKYADEAGVKILMGDVSRDLLKQLKAYIDNIKEEKKREAAGKAIFPCVLKIIPNCVCDKKDSIVRRVDVLEGTAKVGTPICFKENGDFLDIGRIASIEINDKTVDTAMEGQQVLITFDGTNPGAQQKMFERGSEVELFSHISRTSIDMLKAAYQDDLSLEEWNCLMSLKPRLNIQ